MTRAFCDSPKKDLSENFIQDNIFLKLEGIKKNFGGVAALCGIDLEIRRGEIHCLAGGNGCGKSTLIKIISGVLEPTEGKIYIEGVERKRLKPLDAIECGIQVIYQDFAVFPNLTVAENIALCGEIKNKAAFVRRRKALETAKAAMEKIGAELDPDALVEDLPVSAKQMVAICRAISNEPRLLILDEPTTALTAREVGKLWEVIRGLKEKGIAVLLVDHKLDEIHPIADRLTVIRSGGLVSTGKIGDYSHKRFIRDMTGRDVSDEKYWPAPSEETILSVERLTRIGFYEDISFTIHKGDVLGLTGLLGSGRSEIGEALFGLCPAESGRITLHGKELTLNSVTDAVRNEIAYVPEDCLSEGLFPQRSLRDNIVVSSHSAYLSRFLPEKARMEADTEGYMRDLNIVAPSADAPVSSLSGGNAQKVVISKWLNTHSKLLILNGPTVGVDVGAKEEIHSILRSLAADGMGILLITDDLPELVQNCNKILVIRDGRIVSETDNTISKKDIADLLVGRESEAEKA